MEKTVAVIMVIFSFLITCVVTCICLNLIFKTECKVLKFEGLSDYQLQLGIYKSLHRVALFQIVKTGAKENLIESEYLKKSFFK